MADCRGIIALSPQIANFYKHNYDNEFITHLRNGTTVDKFNFKEQGNGRILYLGKIEPRKRQSWLAYNYPDLPIDFIGPIVDNTFQPCGNQRYLGTWEKEQVYQNLTNYSALMLLSGGEAAPLVVPEALAAGLSVIVNQESSANLPESNNPGYFITKMNHVDRTARLSLQTNDAMRNKIRDGAKEYFDWSVIAQDYVKIITQFQIESF
jgi:glycosyltransferase involved in cell wall biosynthesis